MSIDDDRMAPRSASASGDPTPSQEERNWAMLAHLSALSGYLIPFGNLIGPVIVWQVKKQLPFVDDQGKEALNFQITVTLAMLVSAILWVVLIGMLLMVIVGAGALVLTILATVRASEGQAYRYPFTLRLIQ